MLESMYLRLKWHGTSTAWELQKKMAETEELGLTTEDQLEALDSLENGQEVETAEGGEGDVSVTGSNAVDDPVSFI